MAPVRSRRRRAAVRRWGRIRCSSTRRASSSPPISTRRAGEEDASAFARHAGRLGVLAAVERSRSGHGGHVWFFFERGRAGGAGAAARVAPADRGDGAAAGHGAGVVRPLLPEPGHAAAGRLRQPDRAAAAEAGPRDRATACSSTTTSSRGRTSGRSSRTCDGSGEHDVEADRAGGRARGRVVGVRLPPEDEDDDEPWTAPPRGGAGTADRGRAAGGDGARARQPDLRREARAASRPAEPAAAPGGVPESRVLQGPGDAAVDVRQAARHRVRRGPRAAHRRCRAAVSTTSAGCWPTSAFAPTVRDERCRRPATRT